MLYINKQQSICVEFVEFVHSATVQELAFGLHEDSTNRQFARACHFFYYYESQIQQIKTQINIQMQIHTFHLEFGSPT